ncbi:MAG: hypothetical protein WCC60_18385 [Ilumatobacteraceae bacterium]
MRSAAAGSAHLGTIVAFDAAVGLGEVERDDGAHFSFHCIELSDGTRSIEVGVPVTFRLLCKLGRYQAADIARR